jgi:hypothetical protein
MRLDELLYEALEPKQQELYARWKKLINMSAAELSSFKQKQTAAAKSSPKKYPGLRPEVAKSIGISSGVESASWIVKMKAKPVASWTPDMWRWAGKQVSFVSRMLGNSGPMFDPKGRPTRKLLSLLIWGHNPTGKSVAAILKAGEE